ncbi:MAG: HDOD domain-containing protein [Acidimicrobiales bacterium]
MVDRTRTRPQPSFASGTGHFRELPSLPSVIARLVELDRASKGYSDEVEELVASDPSFAIHIVSAANSAASSPASPICTIGSALARVGSSAAVEMLISTGITRVFVPRDEWERSLWRHSIQVAIAAREITIRAGDTGLDANEAYLGGLLHDVGRLVMFQESSDLLHEVDDAPWDSPEGLLATEESVYGIDHAALGAVAAKGWGLPGRLVGVIEHHHDPSALLPGTVSRLAEVVRLADAAMFPSAMADHIGYAGAAIDTVEDNLMPLVSGWMRLDAVELHDLITETTLRADSIGSRLGV